MCGVTGLVLPGRAGADIEPLARAMADTMAHRGPDGAGAWSAEGVALGHRRLAIIDLSPAGAQPMRSATGRYAVSYNGEIYNFRELRQELEGLGHAFSGGSDTEVMLAAVEQWGVAQAVGRFVGMFAFGLWDEAEKTLWLCRDRLGVKPLYYAVMGGGAASGLAFASELKALRALPDFDPDIDREAVTLFMRHNYIPAPLTIYRAARKLPPGCLARFAPGASKPEVIPYWSLREVWQRGVAEPFAGGPDEAAEALSPLLADAVRLRMIADVPVGVLLSGGIDSSLTAALMREAVGGETPVRAFTVGFSEAAYDESAHAGRVARALGLSHTVLPVSATDLLDLVPHLPRMWDEPFADASQVPTHLVFKRLAGEVVVALTGDGADECFAGYARYGWAAHFAHVERFPLALRRLAAGMCSLAPGACLNLLGPRGRKLRWRAGLLSSRDFPTFYRALVSHHLDPAALVVGGSEPSTPLTEPGWLLGGADRLRQMQAWDMAAYLPDDILVKADRASMGASIEARSPFLDHRVVEFATALPPEATVREGRGKQPLRRLLARRLPPRLFERPKAGFTLPVEAWLGHELREWAEPLLSRRSLSVAGLLDPEPVRKLWKAYLAGDTSRHSLLWNALMLQAWHEHWIAGGAT
ncbi:asparagine synthase (glutamine-hydrolyzing) [Alkalidesulfovibrio alkalitolerans DSM 16529]|uniref:asparagine synthase (glutamine-hydrolyzing) n=1 Tax=Alkalidesulfovibrio alkalitolerans DSM 16529 TaxID=1121439 RepID=S7TFV8_9BACT|nr:asparagine synthase (glutamine-hydrolyzing) [Alkalidesulfovibrio alkalitolerans]EPR35626.1 asparagine synthase (glutamine-hydrolyzing) [Alkalidesulfovibrio alkalitolerans DSM 16529]